MNPQRLAVGFLGFLVLSTPALADPGWDFALTPYLWFAGLKGDVATIPGLPSVPIDVSSSQALEDTDAGVMVMFDARKQRHGFMVDFLYTDVRSDTELLPPPISLNMKSISKTTIATLAYQYMSGTDKIERWLMCSPASDTGSSNPSCSSVWERAIWRVVRSPTRNHGWIPLWVSRR